MFNDLLAMSSGGSGGVCEELYHQTGINSTRDTGIKANPNGITIAWMIDGQWQYLIKIENGVSTYISNNVNYGNVTVNANGNFEIYVLDSRFNYEVYIWGIPA